MAMIYKSQDGVVELESSTDNVWELVTCVFTKLKLEQFNELKNKIQPVHFEGIFSWVEFAAATSRIRLAVETIPSFAPKTAARSQPMCWDRCDSVGIERLGIWIQIQIEFE